MSKSILIVDDERLLTRTLTNALRDAGYSVLAAGSAEQAEKHFAGADGPDLVILDNRLPKKSGLEVLREIRDAEHSCRVILMTAYGGAEVRKEAQRLKVDRYVLKPFDLETMMSTVSELLAQDDPLEGTTRIGGR